MTDESTESPTILLSQLANAVQARSSQDQVLWTVFSVFCATHVVLLGALLAGGGMGGKVAVAASGIGTVLGTVWFWIQRRALGYIERIEFLIDRIEMRLSTGLHDLTISGAWSRRAATGVSARSVMQATVLIIAVAWLSFFVLALQSVERRAASSAVVVDIERSIRDGLLRFEVRGLSNDENTTSGFTQFTHRATVVAVGDEKLMARSYMVLWSVKRVAGGDPDSPRPLDDYAAVLLIDGAGKLEVSGGLRTEAESWAPEQIQLGFLGAIPVSVAQPRGPIQ